MNGKPDPRRHAFRPDIADIRLKGKVDSERYVEGEPCRIICSAAPLKRDPRPDAPLETEVIRGEVFTVFERTGEGWAWGQLRTDGYVGYVPEEALGAVAPEPTHRVTALRTFIYPGPDMKMPVSGWLSMGSEIALGRSETTRGTVYHQLAGADGWVGQMGVTSKDTPPCPDFVDVAQRFLGTPYLWGGRTSFGLDCSALVQRALAEADVKAPRDTDMQQGELGNAVEEGMEAPLHRGDLVFWKGHVAIMLDGEYMVHASGHHMEVVIEPLHEARARTLAAGGGDVTAVRRIG